MAKWPYSTRRWQRVRAAKLAEHPLCTACLRMGRTTPATQVDHRTPISKGGDAWAADNLDSLCHACHSAKTLHVDRRGRESVPVRGCDVNGMPLDPMHPWNQEAATSGATGGSRDRKISRS